MDEILTQFLDMLIVNNLKDYLSDEGKALIQAMRDERAKQCYEDFIDQCVEMGMDREVAVRLTRKP